MTTKSYPIIGTKSSLLWDQDTDAWVYISGKPERKEDPRSYYKIIPTLYRGVDIRASSIANLPWAIMDGETEFETSDEYENKTGLIDNINTMLYLVEASLVLAGVSYWKREQNAAGYDKLRHLDPASLVLDEDRAINGELVWKRSVNTKTVEFTPDEIVYIWYPDPFVEIGPPSSWPVRSALNACGVLANLDEFAKAYFSRGAIKAMIFSMAGASREQALDFENWWSKFVTGIRNAFRTKVVNAEKVTPVVVGEGIKELENVTITQEKREEIALALAIPMSILFANAANYATAERDKLNWYEDKVVPEAKFIASILNEQIFTPLGLKPGLVFRPETLDIFQADEQERAASLSQFMDAFLKFPTFELAWESLLSFGYEMTPGWEDAARAYYAQKESRADELVQNLQRPAEQEEPPQPEPDEDEEEAPPMRSLDMQQVQAEVSRWQSKVLKAIGRGASADSVAWVPVSIPAENYERIVAGLGSAETPEAVKDVFAGAFRDEPEVEQAPAVYSFQYAELMQELKLLNGSIANEKTLA